MAFDREYFIKYYGEHMTNHWTRAQIEAKADEEVERYAATLSDANALHLNYYSNIISKKDLAVFSKELESFQIPLSSFNKSGVAYANLEDFSNMMNVVLQSELVKNIFNKVIASAAWDLIKSMIKSVFAKTKNETVNHNTGSKTTKKNVTFGFHFSVNSYTGLTFRLDRKSTVEEVDQQLEAAKKLAIKRKPNDHPTPVSPPFFLQHKNSNLHSYCDYDAVNCGKLMGWPWAGSFPQLIALRNSTGVLSPRLS